jgi:hypothetical protein
MNMSRAALLSRYFASKRDYSSCHSRDEKDNEKDIEKDIEKNIKRSTDDDINDDDVNDNDINYLDDDNDKRCIGRMCQKTKFKCRSKSKNIWRRHNKWSYSKIYFAWLVLSAFTSIMMHLCMMITGYELFYFLDLNTKSIGRTHGTNVVNAISFFEPVIESSSDLNSTQNETINSLESLQIPLSLDSVTYACNTNSDCGNNGLCEIIKDVFDKQIGSACSCKNSYITVGSNFCGYHQLSMWIALLLSIFFGGCGLDRCFLSRGNFFDICIGIFKGATGGCFGILWILDPILICSKVLNDGNGQPLDFKLSSLF